MQRYTVTTEDTYDMEPDSEGIWVLYDDALAAIRLAIENTMAFADQPKEHRTIVNQGLTNNQGDLNND